MLFRDPSFFNDTVCPVWELMVPAYTFQSMRLLQAGEQGDAQACRELIAQGARGDLHDAQGRTALMLSARRGNVASVDVLAGVSDLNAQDPQGRNALMWAIEHDHPRCVAALATRTHLSTLDVHGLSAWQQAVQAQRWGCVDVLAAHTPAADVDCVFAQAGAHRMPQWAAQQAQGASPAASLNGSAGLAQRCAAQSQGAIEPPLSAPKRHP